jgi:hypothetical protein
VLGLTLWRLVAACWLLALGVGFAWYGWSIVDNIWGAGDSPAWAYVMFGLPLIVVGICCLAAAGFLIRRRRARPD